MLSTSCIQSFVISVCGWWTILNNLFIANLFSRKTGQQW